VRDCHVLELSEDIGGSVRFDELPDFRPEWCLPLARRRCSAAVLRWRSLVQLVMDADQYWLLGMKPDFGSEVILDAFNWFKLLHSNCITPSCVIFLTLLDWALFKSSTSSCGVGGDVITE
jgi:hypothetical protein